MSVKNSDTSFWKNMAKIWPKVEGNCLWYIGDGVSVNAWNDRWIVMDIKIADPSIHIPMQLHAAKIVNLMKEDG